MSKISRTPKSNALSDLLATITQGDSSATTVVQELKARANLIDLSHAPDAVMYYASVLNGVGIRGAALHRFYEVCGFSMPKMLTLLRAKNFSLMSTEQLLSIADGSARLPNLVFLNEEVRKLDKNFGHLNS